MKKSKHNLFYSLKITWAHFNQINIFNGSTNVFQYFFKKSNCLKENLIFILELCDQKKNGLKQILDLCFNFIKIGQSKIQKNLFPLKNKFFEHSWKLKSTKFINNLRGMKLRTESHWLNFELKEIDKFKLTSDSFWSAYLFFHFLNLEFIKDYFAFGRIYHKKYVAKIREKNWGIPESFQNIFPALIFSKNLV